MTSERIVFLNRVMAYCLIFLALVMPKLTGEVSLGLIGGAMIGGLYLLFETDFYLWCDRTGSEFERVWERELKKYRRAKAQAEAERERRRGK